MTSYNQVSLWEQETVFKQYDFAIIGGGLVGLWCALALQERNAKAKILILEKNAIPSGASTRNAGFACFGSPTEMINNAHMMGEEKMWPIVEMRYKGIEKIRKILGDAAIDFDACGGYECLATAEAIEVNKHLPWLNKGMKAITGQTESFTWCDEKLGAFGLTGFERLIENRLEGGLHSGKLVKALTQKVMAAGVTILYGMEVTDVTDLGKRFVISAANGLVYNANKILYCTNGFTNLLVPEANVIPARGQVLVTNAISNLSLKGTFHYNQGFYYFRNAGNRVLLGGARNQAFDQEKTTDLNTTAIIQHELERFLAEHILKGKEYEITHRWSGIMGFTHNKEPQILSTGNNALAVIACNGMGVALSPIIAERVAAMF